ncbi:MAG: hypothetical protein VYA08_15130, partial [Pseudomonadota bacterium]|nr:hypothetical protein [Pseudomonadota bacterium]
MKKIIQLTMGFFLVTVFASSIGAEPVKHTISKAEIIKIAMSAAPDNISAQATILNSAGTVLREGTNGWTCMP